MQNLSAESLYYKYALFLFLFLSAFIVLTLVKFLLAKRFERAAEKTKNDFDDLLVNLLRGFDVVFDILFGLFFATQFVDLHERVDFYISRVSLIVVIFYVTRFLVTITNYGFRKILTSKKEKEEFDPTMLKVVRKVSGTVLWIVAIIVVLQNFGYNVSTLVGGLGLAGIALAFGLQSFLEDIFSFFSIYIDKPFKVGDSIQVGDDSGKVKRIGMKSTIIKTLRGENLVISNRELTQVRIHNYRTLKKRRVAFDIGVEYGTSKKKLEKISLIIKKIVKGIDQAEFSRVHFKEFGESALVFGVVYFVLVGDFRKHMDIREKVNFKIVEAFEKEKISMAFPSQTIYVRK